MARSVGSEAANLLYYGRARYWLVGFAFLGEWGESFLSVDWFPSPGAAPMERCVFCLWERDGPSFCSSETGSRDHCIR